MLEKQIGIFSFLSWGNLVEIQNNKFDKNREISTRVCAINRLPEISNRNN